MKKYLAILLLTLSGNAFALGEIFALTTVSGTEFCAGFQPLALKPSNTRKIYIRVDSETSASVFIDYLKPEADYVADLNVAFIASNKLSFDLFVYEDNANHAELIGTVVIDKYGLAKTLKGTFLTAGILSNCYDSGKVVGKRIN